MTQDEKRFCKDRIDPWLRQQGIVPRRIRNWHDYLLCVHGRLVILEAKKGRSASRRATQKRDKRWVESQGGLWFWVYPENWEEVKNELIRLAS